MNNTEYNKMNYTTFFQKCKTCDRNTLLEVCVKCLSKDSNLEIIEDKKSELETPKISCNIKSIMDIHKLKVIKNSKNPSFKDLGSSKPKNKRYTWDLTSEIINENFLKKNNWGIICNKKSGVFGVDLDMYKWSEKDGCHKSKEFHEKFGMDFVKQFNTYTQKTPSGGIHLIFEYDKDLDQTESKKDSKFGKGIDIRNGHNENILGGGYLVGAGSVFKDKNGNVGKYEILHDSDIKPIPQKLKTWLLENIYTAQENIDGINKKIKKDKVLDMENQIFKNVYSYYIDDKQFEKEVIKKLPKSCFTEYNDWLKFTSGCKMLNFNKLWDNYSEKLGGNTYNKNNNLIIWNSIKLDDKENFYIEYLFKLSNNYNYLDFIKYKQIPKNNTKPKKIINRPKLSVMIDESLNTDKPLELNLDTSQKGYILKSDTGTGKTTLMKKELQMSGQKFLSIVSRISLGKEQYHSFNQHGIDCHFYANHWANSGDSIITTIDSIKGCNRLMGDIGEYTIFIDEFNSVLEYIFQADTCLNKSRSTIWKYLIFVLQNCKNFVCVDADISDLCFKFLEYIDRPYDYIFNKFKHNKGVNAEEIYSLEKFIEKINKEDKYLVACDSKKSAEYIYLQTGKNAKLLTSKTDKLDDKTLDDYDKIIFSPAIIYGLDSNIRRKVFCYHKEFTISPTNMIQQISRCRDIIKLYFCFQKKKFNKCSYTDFNECKKDLILRGEFSKTEFNPLEKCEIERQELFNNLYTDYLYKNDCYNTNKYCHFKKLLIDRGFKILTDNSKTTKLDKDKINEEIFNWKMETFDIEDKQLQDFNDKYLKLENHQLLEIKDLFIKDELMDTVFKLKNYFEYGVKNNPSFDSKKEYESIKDDLRYKDITHEQLPNKYDMDMTYENLSNTEEMKLKKINTTQYKFYMIDKLKVLCDYKEINNTITANKLINDKEKKSFIHAYKFVFGHRGKTDPKLNNNYDCEKMISNMLKKTFSKEIMKKPLKIRDGNKTKYEHTINYDCNGMIISKKIVEFQKHNKLENEKKRINNQIDELDFIDDLD